MLKHTDITRRRIQAFLKNDLLPLRYGTKESLKIEVNRDPAKDQNVAIAGKWETVEPGFKYGPAYKVFWFRISGSVSEAIAGKPTVLVADIGGERTVWRNNTPYCGMDIEHSDFGWLEGARFGDDHGFPTAGDKVEEYLQVYTRNAQTTVFGKEAPREELVETVNGAYIVETNPLAIELAYDFEFALQLMETIADNDPAYSCILRALNDVVNLFSTGSQETFERGKKILREALGSLNGEIKHSLYAVGHAHLDTAWLWPLDITHLKMAHTTANQLRLMEKYPEYIFVHSQASQYEWIEKEHPKLFEEVRDAVKRGQWEPVGSMWIEADCNLTGPESLVRQFLYGKRYFREKFNVETKDMWLPDVFGYSAAIPQLLEKFGIKYFFTQKISWSQFNKFPHHTFWWQGIDGTRVWTHFSPADTYNANCEPKEVAFTVRNYRDHGRADQSLYVFGHGDGGGGPTERHLEFLKRGRMAPNYPFIHSRKKAVDFFKESAAKSKDLITWSGELYLELHRGTLTSQANNKINNRTSEFLLRDAELLSCFTSAFPKKYPAGELERLWKLVLLNQFHDIIPGSSVREVYEDSDRDYAEIISGSEAIIKSSLELIGEKFDRSEMVNPVAVFQNATVPTQVQIPWSENDSPTSFATAEETLPVQKIECFDESSLIFPTPSAALGSVTVGDLGTAPVTTKRRLKASPRKLENNEWSVKFDPYGNITSIESLEEPNEYIEPGKLGNLFQLFDDKPLFWSAWDVDIFSLETGQDLIKSDRFELVEKGPVRVAVELEKRFSNSRIRQRISLGPTPGIRFDTEIDWHEEDKLLKVAFPINVNATRATYEIQFGNVERPTHRNTSWDMAKFEVCAQKWVDLSEGDQGVALLNNGKYGFDCHGNVLRMSLLRSPKAPDPQCDMGTHRFSYVLMPHFGSYRAAGVVQAAYALNATPRFAHLPIGSGTKGQVGPFIACEDRNIAIESVKKAEDSSDIIVRLYETHNTRGRASLTCLRAIKQAALCDLEEHEQIELEVEDGQVQFEFRPFEIITIKLKV